MSHDNLYYRYMVSCYGVAFDNRSVFWDKYLEFENALLQKNDVLTYSVDGTNVNLELKLNGVERQLNFKINH